MPSTKKHQDCLHLSGIRCYGYTGALPEEQILGQWFEIDIRLWFDMTQPAQTDCLADTLDYRPLLAAITELMQQQRFHLIETLATAIVDLCLRPDHVQRAAIRVTKLAPPVPNFTGQISVELERDRQAP
ncbi:dihydroneopterin aldolase [Synechococcus sp. PCC 6717]|jgi:dihydroneopterin aldolase|uniref:7,8-dihydroneopterin aldolase n=1 Tax=Parathermosynechococcus lividus PCC 6715 TaxID=1917166 RepID=A0A2D2Q0J8_PARLV|nr:dihydroneopterin aldolase [Thermostichus lividus]ATS18026.1 dihydroneopterin aldolase [Thermostichus lividus PCC 6715]MCI3279590.1 dihydroneopterin aldolase [Synechococcus sp. PCC 6717]